MFLKKKRRKKDDSWIENFKNNPDFSLLFWPQFLYVAMTRTMNHSAEMRKDDREPSRIYSLSTAFLHFLFGGQIAAIKHQDWFNVEAQEHVHKLHAVPHIPANGKTELVEWDVPLLLVDCLRIVGSSHWSVASPLASFSAQEKAPLCSQQ